jgi:hypothetical protein
MLTAGGDAWGVGQTARRLARALAALAGAGLALGPGVATAQAVDAPVPASPDGGRDCPPVARVLTITVRRRDGSPIPDAALTVSDARRRTVLARRARGSADGVYLVLTEDEMPAAGRGGTVALRLEVAHRSRRRAVRWVVRPGEGGCAAPRVSGPAVVTLP